MPRIRFALLRGVCQLPAYVAQKKGFFRDFDIEADFTIVPTAWLVPEQMVRGEVQFSIIPWTRIASCRSIGMPLKVICGSGLEEAAIVVKTGVSRDEVEKICVPHEGGMKDLTAMGFIKKLGWEDRRLVRMPSGDGAILAFLGEGGEAASMIEPYATILKERGIGTIISRTGDVWKGAPGCSLSTTTDFIKDAPEITQHVVNAYVQGEKYARENPDEAAEIAAEYIGVRPLYIREALRHNHPDVNAIRNTGAMDDILDLMLERGYISSSPTDYVDLRFLTEALASLSA